MQTWCYGVQTHWPVQILQYANLVAFTAFAVCQYLNMCKDFMLFIRISTYYVML